MNRALKPGAVRILNLWQAIHQCLKNKSASSLVVTLGKALHGMPLPLSGLTGSTF